MYEDSLNPYPFSITLYGRHMFKGKIKRIIRDRGYGFIQSEDGREIFFHATKLQEQDLKNLKEGDPVEFDVEKDRLSYKCVKSHNFYSVRLHR